jgi:hypothetical protein
VSGVSRISNSLGMSRESNDIIAPTAYTMKNNVVSIPFERQLFSASNENIKQRSKSKNAIAVIMATALYDFLNSVMGFIGFSVGCLSFFVVFATLILYDYSLKI